VSSFFAGDIKASTLFLSVLRSGQETGDGGILPELKLPEDGSSTLPCPRKNVITGTLTPRLGNEIIPTVL
jgi:hypothetical protein